MTTEYLYDSIQLIEDVIEILHDERYILLLLVNRLRNGSEPKQNDMDTIRRADQIKALFKSLDV